MNSNRLITPLIAFTLMLAAVGTANAAADPYKRRDDDRNRPPPREQSHVDSRYNHNRSYPVRGYVAPALPRGYNTYRYRGSPYYYSRGSWYRPYGPRYRVVAPPFGIGVAFLPPYYTTVWIGGSPYYYADQTYYSWRPERREYVVTQPPSQATDEGTEPQGSEEIFVYPKNGQSQDQQDSDRYECHSWAVEKTGFDPTRPQGNVAESEISSKRADYRRAEGACLDARGYSVK
jgi:hypothetical protein